MKKILLVFFSLVSGIMAVDRKDSPLLAGLIEGFPPFLREVAKDENYEVQILYVRVDRSGNKPVFVEHGWRLDSDRYFYPASTVKFPVALFALEKLDDLQKEGLDRNSTMLTEKSEDWQTDRLADPSSKSGKPSIAHDVRKIFLVSDNDSYNRLYEFVGPETIHNRFGELGLKKSAIFHRLSVGDSGERGRSTNPIRFLNEGGKLLHFQSAEVAPKVFGHGKKVTMGKGFWRRGELIEQPMDFSDLNFFPLAEQHQILRRLFFPDLGGLKLSQRDRKFVIQTMGQYPRENKQVVDEKIRNKPDLYVKNFLRWLGPPVRDSLRCYNKSGRAYGYLTDNAYLVDKEKGIEFFLSATIHVNANRIYNDNLYEYDKIGEPFFAELAKSIYQLELNRR